MKYKTKDIKKLGRTYGKRKFKLIDADAHKYVYNLLYGEHKAYWSDKIGW